MVVDVVCSVPGMCEGLNVCRVQNHYPILFRGVNGTCAHEFIIDLRKFKVGGGRLWNFVCWFVFCVALERDGRHVGWRSAGE